MTGTEREWWGLVDLARWDDQREARARASAAISCVVERDEAGRRVSVTLRWFAHDLNDALRRVREAAAVDPAAFESGYPLPL